VDQALAQARRRLAVFVAEPQRHARYAAKVLVKFKLLEWQRVSRRVLHAWGVATPHLAVLHRTLAATENFVPWLDAVVAELARSGAARLEDGWIVNI
jgi:hypothetical protein